MKPTSRAFCILAFCILASYLQSNTNWTVIYSSQNEIRLKLSSKGIYTEEIEPFYCLLGLPTNEIPNFEFNYLNPLELFDEPGKHYPIGVDWLQFQLLKGLHTGTLVISPFSSAGIAYEEVIVTIHISGNISTPESIISPRIASFFYGLWAHTVAKLFHGRNTDSR